MADNNNNDMNDNNNGMMKEDGDEMMGKEAMGASIHSSGSSSRLGVYRRALQRIATDSMHGRRHVVPESGAPHANPAWYTREGVQSYKESVRRMSRKQWLETLVPMTRWLQDYHWRSTFLSDFIAGCTVGFMVVPQSLSYAKLANLPVQYGLYSAFLPVYAYAVFGSSRQLAIGPVALVSLLLGTGISEILAKEGVSTSNKQAYQQASIAIAIQTSFLVGLGYIVMGLMRLGFITILLSHAVVSGFITAAAIIIGTTQLKYFFGYSIPQSEIIYEILGELFQNISKFNYRTFLVASGALALLILMKHVGKTIPKLKYARVLGPLTVTIIGIILDATIDLAAHGIPVVGNIPKGLPHASIDLWTPIEHFQEILPLALSIGLVGFMESIAIAKSLAAQHKYSLDSSLELMGLGMANFVGAMAQSYPVTGSFSRSAVNNDSGAQSGLSGMVTATLVMLVLLFLTPIFERVPLAVLGAIVVSGVLGLLDFQEAISLWKVDRFDCFVWIISFLGTLFLGVQVGLLIAVGVSLLLVIYESAYPHTAILGRLPGSTVYRNIKQYPEAETFDGIVLMRIDAPIYFANTQNIREKMEKYRDSAELRSHVKFIVLELSPVSHIDSSALHILKDVIEHYEKHGIQMCLSNPSVRVMERLVVSGLADQVGREHIFVTAHDAVNWCLNELDKAEMTSSEDLEGQQREEEIPLK